jgi:hypothetical protein
MFLSFFLSFFKNKILMMMNAFFIPFFSCENYECMMLIVDEILSIFCQARSQLQPSWTELALLSLWYQPASHPPRIVSNSNSNVKRSIQTRFTQLKMEENFNFFVNGRRPQHFCKFKTTSTCV